jgi:hypothetical protein
VRSTRLLSLDVDLHPDSERSGSTQLIVAKRIAMVLVLCSGPPHSSPLQTISDGVGLPLILDKLLVSPEFDGTNRTKF